MFEEKILAFSESAQGADYFNTKINNFEGNFKISGDDGPPNFQTLGPQITTSDAVFNADFSDTKLDSLSATQDIISHFPRPEFSNSRPNFSLTDVNSYDNLIDSKSKLTPLTQNFNFSNLPKPRLLPVGPVMVDNSQITQSDFHLFTRNDTDSQIYNANVESHSESEPEEVPIDDSLIGHSEFVLQAETHYDPNISDQDV